MPVERRGSGLQQPSQTPGHYPDLLTVNVETRVAQY